LDNRLRRAFDLERKSLGWNRNLLIWPKQVHLFLWAQFGNLKGD